MIFCPHLLIFLIASVNGFSTSSKNAKKAPKAAMAVVVIHATNLYLISSNPIVSSSCKEVLLTE